MGIVLLSTAADLVSQFGFSSLSVHLLSSEIMGEEKVKKEKKSKKKDKADESAASEAEGAGGGDDSPKKAQRATSNVFALFNQAQIQEFKEAFTLMDQDRDGILSQGDLAAMFEQTGREANAKLLDEMIAESPGQLNFTHFLTLFGEKMHGTDSESALRDAFALFDEGKTGVIAEDYMKELLSTVGDQFSKEELKQCWKEAPIESGKLDYVKFTQYIKRGKEEDLM